MPKTGAEAVDQDISPVPPETLDRIRERHPTLNAVIVKDFGTVALGLSRQGTREYFVYRRGYATLSGDKALKIMGDKKQEIVNALEPLSMVDANEKIGRIATELARVSGISQGVSVFHAMDTDKWLDYMGVGDDTPAYKRELKATTSFRGARVMVYNGKIGIVYSSSVSDASDADMYGVIAHEIGHAVMSEHWEFAPEQTRKEIEAAYRDFINSVQVKINTGISSAEFRRYRAGGAAFGAYLSESDKVSDKDASRLQYELSFEEWFADNVGDWFRTNKTPVSRVEKFFAGIANALKALYANVAKHTPVKSLHDWLDSVAATYSEATIVPEPTVAPEATKIVKAEQAVAEKVKEPTEPVVAQEPSVAEPQATEAIKLLSNQELEDLQKRYTAIAAAKIGDKGTAWIGKSRIGTRIYAFETPEGKLFTQDEFSKELGTQSETIKRALDSNMPPIIEETRAKIESVANELAKVSSTKVEFKCFHKMDTEEALDYIGKTEGLARTIDTLRASDEGMSVGINGDKGVILFSDSVTKSEDAEIYGMVSHEIGHVVMTNAWIDATPDTKQAVQAEYDSFLVSAKDKISSGMSASDFRNMRAAGVATADVIGGSVKMSSQSQARINYETSFNEWFADNVADWFRSSAVPVTRVEKFFSGISQSLKNLYAKFSGHYPVKPLHAWLDTVASKYSTSVIVADKALVAEEQSDATVSKEEAPKPVSNIVKNKPDPKKITLVEETPNAKTEPEEDVKVPYISPAWNVVEDNEYSIESFKLLTSRAAKAEMDTRYGIEMIERPNSKTFIGKMIFRNKHTGTMFGLTNDQVEIGNAMFMSTDTRYGFVAAASDVANGITKSDAGRAHTESIVAKRKTLKSKAGSKIKNLKNDSTADQTMLYFASKLADDSMGSKKTIKKYETLKEIDADESVWLMVRDTILSGAKMNYAAIVENISMVSADVSGTTKGALSKANVQEEQMVSLPISPRMAQDWGLVNKKSDSKGATRYGAIKASSLLTSMTDAQMDKLELGNDTEVKAFEFLELLKTSPDMVRRATAELVVSGDKYELLLDYSPDATKRSVSSDISYNEGGNAQGDGITPKGFAGEYDNTTSDETINEKESAINTTLSSTETQTSSLNDESVVVEDVAEDDGTFVEDAADDEAMGADGTPVIENIGSFDIARITDSSKAVDDASFNDLYMQRLAGAEKDVKSKSGITLGDLGPAVYDTQYSVGTRLVFGMRADASPSAAEANKVKLDPVQIAQASKFARQCVDIFDKLGHSTEGMKELAQDPDVRNTRGLISHILSLDPSEARTVADVENLRELNNLAADMYDRIRKPVTDFEARMSIFGDTALKELVARGDVSKEDGALMMAMYRALKMNANIVAIDNLNIPSGVRAFISEATNTIGFKTTIPSKVQSFTHELVHAGFRSLPAQAKKDYNNAFFNTQYNIHPDGKVEFAPSSYQNRAAQNSAEFGELDVLFPVTRLGAIDEMIAEAGARKLLLQETPIGIISKTWKAVWDKVEGLYKRLRASFQVDPSIDKVMNAIIKQRGFSQRALIEEHAKAMEELDQAIANGPMGKDIAPAGIPEGYLFNYDQGEEHTGEVIAPIQSKPLAVTANNKKIEAGDYLGKVANNKALKEISDIRDMIINKEDIPHEDKWDLMVKLHSVLSVMPAGNVVTNTALVRRIARVTNTKDAEYTEFREMFIKAKEYTEQKKMLARVRSKAKVMKARYGISGEKMTKELFTGAELDVQFDGELPLSTVFKLVLSTANMKKVSDKKVQEIDQRINMLNGVPDNKRSPLWFKQMISYTAMRSDAEKATTDSMSSKALGTILRTLTIIEQAHKDVTGSKAGIKAKSVTERNRAELVEAIDTRLKLVGDSREAKSIIDMTVNLGRTYRTTATPQLILAQVLDSYNPNGVFTRLFAKAAIKASSQRLGIQQKLFDVLGKALKNNGVDVRDVSEYGMISPDRDKFIAHGGGFKYTTSSGEELLITKGEAIAIAGTAMDPDGYDGLVREDVHIKNKTYTLSDEDIHGITAAVNNNPAMKATLFSLRTLYDFNGRTYIKDFIAKTSGNDVDLEPNHYPLNRKSATETVVEDILIWQWTKKTSKICVPLCAMA
jgi:hypothetical protein